MMWRCMLEIRASYRENNLEKRIKYSKKILDLIPDNAFAHLRMAYTYWESADIENSRKYLVSSIEKDKYYSEPYGALIQNYMFYEPKSHEKAEKYANQILSYYKNESYYHVALEMYIEVKINLKKQLKNMMMHIQLVLTTSQALLKPDMHIQ